LAESIGAVVDTSVFVALEQRRPIRRVELPPVRAISVVTLAELRLAVFNSTDPFEQAVRLQTLEKALRVHPVPIDEVIAFQWAVLRSAARSLSQSRINDLWIAATAMALRVPVITQDDGFARLAEVGGPTVIRV